MFKRLFPTLIALICGWLVLLGALLPIKALVQIRTLLVQWAAVVGVFAFILAALSVVGVHTRRLRSGPDKVTSFLILVAVVGSFGLVVTNPYGEWASHLLNYVLIPGESSLLALTAVTLLVSGMRIFQTRRNLEGFIFIIVVLFMLISAVPYIYPPILQTAIWWTDIMATSGMRGLIIGVALGTILTGFRILFGTDRPYSDE